MLSWCCHLGCFMIWVFFNLSGEYPKEASFALGDTKSFLYIKIPVGTICTMSCMIWREQVFLSLDLKLVLVFVDLTMFYI